jgi:membrane protein
MGAVVRIFQSWIERFVGIQGVDRAMSLAALAFSALIPLLIVYTAVVPRPDSDDFADELIERFDLEGDSAETLEQAFATSTSVTDGLSGIGVLLLIVSALSFTRGLQRLYESAYGLEARGYAGTLAGLQWLGAFVVFIGLRPLVADLVSGDVAKAVVSLALGGVLWTMTPFLLLGRRLSARRLTPGAVLAAIGNTALGATTVYWLPRTIAESADQYGAMGVSFALLGWLVAGGFVIVTAATGGAVASERIADYRERRA